MKEVHDIFDRASKRCISLSKRGTIMLINGLYGKNYSLDSEVEYHWTEHNDSELKRTLADTIVTVTDKVNGQKSSYHMKIQMYADKEIVMRVFEYGYRHALVNRDGQEVLQFPGLIILYLYEDGNAPDLQELHINFGEQGEFVYQVLTFKYLKISLEELKRRQLIVLLPFQLLRLRKAIEKERTTENMEALKELIGHDIINTIQENVAAGNISIADGRKLKRITLQLYHHVYEKYEELEKAGVNEIVEEAMILDIDIIEWEHKKELERERERVRKEMEEENAEIIGSMAEKLRSLGVSEEEIAQLTQGKEPAEE